MSAPATGPKAEATVRKLVERWGPGMAHIEPGSNAEVAERAEIVVLGTNARATVATAAEHAARLAGKPVVSMANAMRRVGSSFEPVPIEEGSIAQAVQKAAPEALVAAALHHIPAGALMDLDKPCSDGDVAVVSDDLEAMRATQALVSAMPELRAARRRAAGERHRPRGVLRRAPHRQPALRRARRPSGSCRLVRSPTERADPPLRHRPAGDRPVRAAAARADVRLRHHALRLHPPGPRRHLPDLRRPHPPARGAGPRRGAGPQRDRRRRLDPPQGPPAGRQLSRAGRRRDGPVPLRHGGARDAAAGVRTPGHRGRPPDHRAGRAASWRPGTPTRPTAACSSTSRRSPATAQLSAPTAGRRCSASPPSGAAGPTTRSSGTRSTSRSGSGRPPTSPPGTPPSAPAGRAGTSSARPWCWPPTARPSTSTAAAPT